ncbi:MAG: hypothetical protein V7L29_33820 [Nostoc sp.]|uniref:hypothetical protein n=1 Tax=Nostoc sp. TaxID=1180 RepID=UPI002FF54AD7
MEDASCVSKFLLAIQLISSLVRWCFTPAGSDVCLEKFSSPLALPQADALYERLRERGLVGVASRREEAALSAKAAALTPVASPVKDAARTSRKPAQRTGSTFRYDGLRLRKKLRK